MTGKPKETQTWEALFSELSAFSERMLRSYSIRGKRSLKGDKVVRDAVHGFHTLKPWEVEILDCPLVQRLRYIHQTALAYQVYPSANHSRLEHSLGAAKVVADVASSMRQDKDTSGLFDDQTVGQLRIGALLHDVGHCLFSHLTETVMDQRFGESLAGVKRLPLFGGRDTGEILSYGLITSPAMRRFLEAVFGEYGRPFSVDEIAGYCIGVPKAPDTRRYQTELISGPLDVDKLDYLRRDGHFTGIKSDIDVPHIIRSMTLWHDPTDNNQTLVARMSGISSVEQLHFCKALLIPAIYQHQKVRAMECTVRGIFEVIWDNPTSVPRAMRFNSITDFLSATEQDFYAMARFHNQVGRRIAGLLQRRILRRALHISYHSLEPSSDQRGYKDLIDLGDQADPRNANDILAIRKKILRRIHKSQRRDVTDLWLDVPPAPKIGKDIRNCKVLTASEDDVVNLTDVFPIGQWLNTYSENKWASHVFYVPDEIALQEASKAAADVLGNEFGLRFSNSAFLKAKQSPPRIKMK